MSSESQLAINEERAQEAEEQCRISTPHAIGYGHTGNSRANLGADEARPLGVFLHFRYTWLRRCPQTCFRKRCGRYDARLSSDRVTHTQGVDMAPGNSKGEGEGEAEAPPLSLSGAPESSRRFPALRPAASSLRALLVPGNHTLSWKPSFYEPQIRDSRFF